jgi:tetratricopeptide (TPR) repeat protein
MTLIIVPIVFLAVFLSIGVVWFSPELRGDFFLWRGQLRRARKIFEYLIEQNPEKISLYRKLAKIYYLENRRDKKALKIFEIIIRLKIPFEWRDEILTDVAKYYIIEGRKDAEAIKLIEKAVDREIKLLRG